MNAIKYEPGHGQYEPSAAAYFENIKNNPAALRQFFAAMPKGGDIHNHLTGSAYAETYFELAAKKRMYVNLETGRLYKSAPADIETIRLSPDMDDLHNKRMALIDKWSIRNFQPTRYPLGPDEYFFGTFGLLSALTTDIDNLAYLMHELKVRAVRENVQYLEVLGCSPSVPEDCFLDNDKYAAYDQALKECVKHGWYTAADNAEKNAQQILSEILNIYDGAATDAVAMYSELITQLDEESNGHPDDKYPAVDTSPVLCRYQGYSSRSGEPLKVLAQLYVVHKACNDDPNKLLVGCNIVAAEDGEKSMLYYRLHMEMFKALAARFPDVPTSLHAGELTLGLVRPEHLTYHIGQAIRIAGAHRIGHGVDLPFEHGSVGILQAMSPEKEEKKSLQAMDQEEVKKIPVEINLTSNEFILGVKGNDHPVMLYHQAGVPLIISTDDPGILRTSLTEQYTLAVLRYGFSYGDIKDIVYNSINYSFLSEEKIDQLKSLDDLFEAFEKGINDILVIPGKLDHPKSGN